MTFTKDIKKLAEHTPEKRLLEDYNANNEGKSSLEVRQKSLGLVKSAIQGNYFFIVTNGAALICIDTRTHLPIFGFTSGTVQDTYINAEQEEDRAGIVDFEVEFINADDVDITINISDYAHQISEFSLLLGC